MSRRRAAAALVSLALLAAGGVAAPCSSAAPDLPTGPLHPDGRWIKDATGRVVIVHGLELARKTPPYYAPVESFAAQDARNIESWGFDAVRLAWFWKGLEPQRGRIDGAYLAQLERAGTLLADHHVFTLLEAHQDGYNERLGGAGFPDWATISDGTWGPVEQVPGTGEFDLQAARAFDNLYANTDGIADAFANAWAVMANGFRNNPMMLGYDLFNEPNPGSQWATCANPVGCPAFDLTTLEPLEDRLAAAVRAVDPKTIAFYEPHIYFDSGVPSWLRAPASTSGPSGLAFHDYCLPAALSGQPDAESQSSGYAACPALDDAVFANAERAATAMGVPPLFDEFGDTQDLNQIQRVIALADSNLTGWIYWGYKDWVDDPGGQGSGPLFDDSDDDGTLRKTKLAVLSQPYPMATAGTPMTEHYDPAADTFTYTYAPDRSISAPTVIFTSPLHYPHGYAVSVTGARVTSSPGARYLELQPAGQGDTVSVRVVPAAAGPAASGATDAQNNPTAPPQAAVPPSAPPTAGALGTASGSCNANADDPAAVASPSLAATHGDVIARVQTSGGAGEVTAPDAISVAYGGGDTSWLDLGPVASATAARASVICRSGPAAYSFAFADAPTPPVSFSGASTHEVNVSLASSRLAFAVPATAHYVAAVAVTQGGIEVGLRTPEGATPPASTFSTTGTEDLGTLQPGAASLDVTALPGAQARWTITIRALVAPGSPLH